MASASFRSTGLFCRDLGWKKTATGFSQHRFYLGRDRHAAAIAIARLEKLWADIEKRWANDYDSQRPIWDETTLAMAKSIIRGDQATFNRPLVPLGVLNETVETELHGVWFARLVKDFPDMNLMLDDPLVKAKITDLAADFAEKAERLKPVSKSKQTLHQALDPYKKWLLASFVTPPEKGKERRTSQTGVKQGERPERLKLHVKNMPLSSFGVKEIEDVVKYWANRPMSSRKTAFAATVCKHQIRLWKHFIKWLHKEPSFSWKRPTDLEWDRVKILEHTHEMQAKMTAEQVETYTREELKILWEYGTGLHRTRVRSRPTEKTRGKFDRSR